MGGKGGVSAARPPGPADGLDDLRQDLSRLSEQGLVHPPGDRRGFRIHLQDVRPVLFGEDRKVRFRCDDFPFVEPGVAMSIDCFACQGEGSGCRICRDSGWIEIMGAGMVHPKVLAGVGYDPEKYTGFAFGLGPERIAMLKYGIDDIRLFYANDLRFLRQF